MSDDLAFLLRGGLVMWPLFLCGVVSVAVMIERFLAIGAAVRDSEVFMNRIGALLNEGKSGEALELCEGSPERIARVVASGLRSSHLDHVWIERSMDEVALKEMPVLTERLSVLDTIITLAPLLGLLGTVTGMIRAFQVAGGAGALAAPAAITSGVSEALIATSVGLTIAVATLPAYNFLVERVKENVGELELRTAQFLNIVVAMKRAAAKEEAGQTS